MSIFFDDEAQLSGTDSGDEEESLLSQDLDFIDLSTEDDSPHFIEPLIIILLLLTLYHSLLFLSQHELNQVILQIIENVLERKSI